jgi:hypothetical protein
MKKDKCSQPLPVKTFKVITGEDEAFMRSIQSVFQ